ncbi:MAG: hypothetical protein QOC81_4554 [Thermoanaerobaculia bacterium]|jgi:hypothetical protein|nr:hypothetical protein [Thermoanaerobaculia bacterium]
MRRNLILFSLLAITSSSIAANAGVVALGVEAPLSPPAVRSAPFDQRLAGIASNGWDFLAIWTDRRSSVPASPNLYAAPLYVSRVDRAGRAVNPFGLRLRDAVEGAALVRTARGYIVLWSENGGVISMLLDDDGVPAGPPKRIADGYIAGATSNGRTIFVVHGASSNPQFASIFTIDGTLLSRTTLDRTATQQSIRPMVLPNLSYSVVLKNVHCSGITPCDNVASLTNVSESGIASTKVLQTVSQWSQTAAVIGDDRLMLAWISENVPPAARTVWFRIFDLAGNPLTPAREIESTNDVPSISGSLLPSAGWDGESFLVTWQWPSASGQTGEIHTRRITTDGYSLDASPAVLSRTLGTAPWFASNGSSQLIAWDTSAYQSSDIAIRSVARFDTLPVAATVMMPDSATLQREVQLSQLGTNTLAVWREGETDPSIVATVIGRPPVVIAPGGTFDQQAPAVSASKSQYLVVWREQAFLFTGPPQPSQRILGKRVSVDGRVLDRDPIVIAQEPAGFPAFLPAANTISVGSDGADFLVVWPSVNDSLHLARVSSAGVALDLTATALPQPAKLAAGGSPRAVWNGQEYVVAWTADPSCKLCGRPPDPPNSRIFVARVSREGKLLDAQQVWSGGYGSRVGLAQGSNGSMLLAWGVSGSTNATDGCVFTMALDQDGTPAGSARVLACPVPSKPQLPNSAPVSSFPPQFPDLDIAWDGASFVVAWTQIADRMTFTRAMHASPSGLPLDAAPFDLGPDDSISFQPALVTTSTGVLVAYDRIAMEAQYGSVARVFSRTLLRSASPARNRSLH